MRSTSPLRTLTLSTLCLVLFSQSVSAQSANTPRPNAEARAHFDSGVTLMQAGRWLEALPEFERARDIQATPPVLYNLALAQRAVGRVRDARATFRALITLAGSSLSAERTTEIRNYMTELDAAVAHLELNVTPSTASITLDGALVAAHETEVDPGRHELVVQAPGHRTERRALEVRRGASLMLELRLEREEQRRRVTVECDQPSASVRFDSLVIGQGNAETDALAGPHELVVEAPGYRRYRREIRVEDANVRLRVSLERTVAAQTGLGVGPIVGITAGAIAVVGVITGLTVWALSGTQDPYPGTWGTVARGSMDSGAGR